MSLTLELRRRGRHIFGPILGALAVAYFMFHAWNGERGFTTWLQLRQQVQVAQSAVVQTTARRRAWQARTDGLQAGNLDPDLLDERARLVAGLAREDEMVIFEGLKTRRHQP